jgi:isovaleryl-CoA dehydrogenase
MSLADALTAVITEVIEPNAANLDRSGEFPRANLDALAEAGLLGLVSDADVGGAGGGVADAAATVEALARACGSTAMIVCMHYAAAAVLEAHGPAEVRRRIAAGEFLATLAFSEQGSRSHFWAPLSTATATGDRVRLDAAKSWVTSAGEADGYVWSSLPMGSEGASTLWLVPGSAPGLKVGAPFDGLGLRANGSSPMAAIGVEVAADAMLGPDGGGLDLMLGVVLPWFCVLSAACCVGTMDAALTKACQHAASTRLEHLDQTLADSPVTRAHLAKARITTDQVRMLLADTIQAIATGRDDATLRVLEVKAAAAEAALEVTDTAMRVGGGAAFRKEVGIERNFRDARAAAVMAPTSDALHDFLGRAICGLPVF